MLQELIPKAEAGEIDDDAYGWRIKKLDDALSEKYNDIDGIIEDLDSETREGLPPPSFDYTFRGAPAYTGERPPANMVGHAFAEQQFYDRRAGRA